MYEGGVSGDVPVPAFKNLLRRMLKGRIHMTAAISAAVAEDIINNRLVMLDHITIIHNGVDAEHFCPSVNWTPRPIVGAAGRLVRRKGFDMLLRAIEQIAKRRPDVRLILAGDGPDRPRLEKLALELGLADKVEFKGELADMPAFLQGLGVFAFPAFKDGFGLTLVEAMSCGIPSVAFQSGGVAEIIRSGENGLLVPWGDVDALAGAIERVLADDEFARCLSSRARRSVMDRFSLRGMTRAYGSVYREVIAKGMTICDDEFVLAPPKDGRGIVLLVDYEEQFYSSVRRLGAGMNVHLLRQGFERAGYQMVVRRFSSIDFRREQFKGWHVLYCSSEDRDLRYKGYIEDVLLGLTLRGAILVPGFFLFRAHHNKVMMEILRDVTPCEDLKTIRSRVYGSYEDYVVAPPGLDGGLVIKPAEGANSKGILLADGPTQTERAARRVSRSFHPVDALKDLIKRWIRYGYAGRSNRRRKFVIQNYIPGLTHDYKVLVYAGQFYVLLRKNRPGDFRASGSGLFEWPDSLPDGLLNTAERVHQALGSPFTSMDMAFDGSRVHILEVQCLHFGTYTLEKSPGYHVRDGGQWRWVAGRSILEEEVVRSVAAFIEADRPGLTEG